MKKRVVLPILSIVALVLVFVAVSHWSQGILRTFAVLSTLRAPSSSGQYADLPGPPPQRDQFALTEALRPGVKGPIPHVVNKETPQFSIGQKQIFWLTDLQKNRHFQGSTTLRFISPHAYFYVEDTANLADDE
ncbi:MAG: hypothetical protein Q7O66_18940, partial [Dehalococcoidia bacterium]|nr:hypothetical protein [Dehalococcoidia bacterium]